jgi:hypothetical protein
MALITERINVVDGRMLTIGKRRLQFAQLLGDTVQVVTHKGYMTIYPEHAKLCQACGELISLEPIGTEPDFCTSCITRIAALKGFDKALTPAPLAVPNKIKRA